MKICQRLWMVPKSKQIETFISFIASAGDYKPDIKCHFLLLLFCHNSKYFVCFPFFFFDLHKTKKEIWYLVTGWCNKRNINKLSEKNNFMLINMLLPFSVLLLSKFEDWNNNLDASLFGMISFSFFLEIQIEIWDP